MGMPMRPAPIQPIFCECPLPLLGISKLLANHLFFRRSLSTGAETASGRWAWRCSAPAGRVGGFLDSELSPRHKTAGAGRTAVKGLPGRAFSQQTRREKAEPDR